MNGQAYMTFDSLPINNDATNKNNGNIMLSAEFKNIGLSLTSLKHAY